MDKIQKIRELEKNGSVIKNRKRIAPGNFVYPPSKENPRGKYPIHDIQHARNALARVAQFGTEEEKKKVREAVHAKYPSIGK